VLSNYFERRKETKRTGKKKQMEDGITGTYTG
jgi:hypothetical protein